MKHFYKQFFLCLLALAMTAFSFAQTVIDFESEDINDYVEFPGLSVGTVSLSGFDFTLRSTTAGGIYYGFDKDNPPRYPESIGYNSIYLYLGTLDGASMTQTEITRTGGGLFDFNKVRLQPYPSPPNYDVPFDVSVQGFRNGAAVTSKISQSTVIKGQGAYGIAQDFDLSGDPSFKGIDKIVITTSIPNDYMAIDNVDAEAVQVTAVDVEMFKGLLTNNVANFSWKSGVETDFDHYELQRSLNGTAFSSVARIAAKGSGQLYQASVAQEVAEAYYRLKLIDRDARIAYSKVITIGNSHQQPYSLYPNPATAYIRIVMPASGRSAIYNASGRKVSSQSLEKGENTVDITGLAAGIYYISVNGRKFSFVKR